MGGAVSTNSLAVALEQRASGRSFAGASERGCRLPDSTAQTGPMAIADGPQAPLGTIARFADTPSPQSLALLQRRRSRLFVGLSASRSLYKAHRDGELAAAGVDL